MHVTAFLRRLALLLIVLLAAPVGQAGAQQLYSGMTAAACAARGGPITPWTSTAGARQRVGDG